MYTLDLNSIIIDISHRRFPSSLSLFSSVLPPTTSLPMWLLSHNFLFIVLKAIIVPLLFLMFRSFQIWPMASLSCWTLVHFHHSLTFAELLAQQCVPDSLWIFQAQLSNQPGSFRWHLETKLWSPGVLSAIRVFFQPWKRTQSCHLQLWGRS